MSRFEGLLDTLREARRYAVTNPDEAKRLVFDAVEKIYGSIPAVPLRGRIVGNLCFGLGVILCAPDVLAGYITGAILEIQDYEAKHK